MTQRSVTAAMLIVAVCFPLSANAWDQKWPPWNSSPSCKCIKNANGVCMTLSRRGMPEYSRGSGTQVQFLPTCVDNCLPGSTLTDGPDPETVKELDRCYVDWKRLERLNPQWHDPNWTP